METTLTGIPALELPGLTPFLGSAFSRMIAGWFPRRAGSGGPPAALQSTWDLNAVFDADASQPNAERKAIIDDLRMDGLLD